MVTVVVAPCLNLLNTIHHTIELVTCVSRVVVVAPSLSHRLSSHGVLFTSSFNPCLGLLWEAVVVASVPLKVHSLHIMHPLVTILIFFSLHDHRM